MFLIFVIYYRKYKKHKLFYNIFLAKNQTRDFRSSEDHLIFKHCEAVIETEMPHLARWGIVLKNQTTRAPHFLISISFKKSETVLASPTSPLPLTTSTTLVTFLST